MVSLLVSMLRLVNVTHLDFQIHFIFTKGDDVEFVTIHYSVLKDYWSNVVQMISASNLIWQRAEMN